MKLDEVLALIRRNSKRLDRVEAALGLKTEQIKAVVDTHEHKIKELQAELFKLKDKQ